MALPQVAWLLIQLFFDSGVVIVSAVGIFLPPPLLGYRRTPLKAKSLLGSKEIKLFERLIENLPA